jgi:hypothetical protein
MFSGGQQSHVPLQARRSRNTQLLIPLLLLFHARMLTCAHARAHTHSATHTLSHTHSATHTQPHTHTLTHTHTHNTPPHLPAVRTPTPTPPPRQEDALRPFVAVLRQCDEPAVRELAVQCVMQAVAAHPRGLGSGWRMATQALRLGAADGAPAVLAQALEALQVGRALWYWFEGAGVFGVWGNVVVGGGGKGSGALEGWPAGLGSGCQGLTMLCARRVRLACAAPTPLLHPPCGKHGLTSHVHTPAPLRPALCHTHTHTHTHTNTHTSVCRR